MTADPALIRGWLTARSIARGLPAPVEDHGGLMVESDGPDERRRWVFACMQPGLRTLGARIDAPRLLLKLCGTGAALLDALPPRWTLAPASYVMTIDQPDTSPVALPAGFWLETSCDGAVGTVRIHAADGMLAASGFAAEAGDVFIFDRIVTAEGYRRLGLGSAVMAALARLRQGPGRCVLVATEDGRALYTRLGWSVHSPYATAFIPGPGGSA